MSANTSEPSAASLLREQHTSHLASVEDTSDEDLGSKPTASTETAGPSTNPEPAATAAKGPRLATDSRELFPELGGANKSAGNVAPVWPARANANGKANGTSPANATPEVSAPPSGAASPAFAELSGAPKLSLPGKHTEFFLMDKAELRPRSEMKRPMADIIRDFNRKSRAQIKVVPHSEEVLRIEVTGPKDATTQSMRDFVALIGARVKLQLDINRWARPHIIGKGGATIKAIEEKTGARVHVPKDDGQTPVDEDDDEAFIQVVVEGNSQQAAHARNIIDRIMGERAGAVTVPVKGIPAEFYPFIAGPNNSYIDAIEQKSGVQIRVPPAQPSSATPPSLPTSDERPVFTPAEANFIQLAGGRDAVKAAREQLEQRAQELREQLTVEPVHIQPGRHQFIIGERGISMDEFFDETGCTIVIPNDEEDDVVKVIGFEDQAAAGVEKTADLAMGMQCSNVDISRFHRQAPGGAAVHARNVTRYLQQKRELERLGKVYNVHFNTPFSEQGALPWELYARDGKSIVKAQSEIKALVDGHPPARMATVAVDPFYHQHIRKEVAPHVRQNFGVHLVVPEASEPKAPVLLVYEGPSDPESFEVARSQPAQKDIGEMQKGLKGAQTHIVELLSGMEAVSSNSIEVPVK